MICNPEGRVGRLDVVVRIVGYGAKEVQTILKDFNSANYSVTAAILHASWKQHMSGKIF